EFLWANERHIVSHEFIGGDKERIVLHELPDGIALDMLDALQHRTKLVAVNYPSQEITRTPALVRYSVFSAGDRQLADRCEELLERFASRGTPLYEYKEFIPPDNEIGAVAFTSRQAKDTSARFSDSLHMPDFHSRLISAESLMHLISSGDELDLSQLSAVEPELQALVNEYRGPNRLLPQCEALLKDLPLLSFGVEPDPTGTYETVAPNEAYLRAHEPYTQRAASNAFDGEAWVVERGSASARDLVDIIAHGNPESLEYLAQIDARLQGVANGYERQQDHQRNESYRRGLAAIANAPLPAQPTAQDFERKALATAELFTNGDGAYVMTMTHTLVDGVHTDYAPDVGLLYVNPDWVVEGHQDIHGNPNWRYARLYSLHNQHPHLLNILQNRILTEGAQVVDMPQLTRELSASELDVAKGESTSMSATSQARMREAVNGERSLLALARGATLDEIARLATAEHAMLPLSENPMVLRERGYQTILISDPFADLDEQPDARRYVGVRPGEKMEGTGFVVDVDDVVQDLVFLSDDATLEERCRRRSHHLGDPWLAQELEPLSWNKGANAPGLSTQVRPTLGQSLDAQEQGPSL
ncbi:MAG TPA: hypothetical protein VKR05_02085, partial [Candidatus Cybelea sp.]|nr:hypothetical protein [Candidatus Cybelea sp.]